MKYLKLTYPFIITIIVVLSACTGSRIETVTEPTLIVTNQSETGPTLELKFEKGQAHNHPLMAVWVTDTLGNYLQTLYVANSIAKGVFEHGDASEGKWSPGAIRRPAALPFWGHNRGIKASDGLFIPEPSDPLPDAVSGATPIGNFILRSNLKSGLPQHIYIYFEINQSWDWNSYWTNNKFPDDAAYKSSCQPALVYQANVNQIMSRNPIPFQLVGRSHYNGSDGRLYTDLETITTAKDISRKIEVRFIE